MDYTAQDVYDGTLKAPDDSKFPNVKYGLIWDGTKIEPKASGTSPYAYMASLIRLIGIR